MAYEMIVCEKKGPVVTLTLNRPDSINARDGGFRPEPFGPRSAPKS